MRERASGLIAAALLANTAFVVVVAIVVHHGIASPADRALFHLTVIATVWFGLVTLVALVVYGELRNRRIAAASPTDRGRDDWA